MRPPNGASGICRMAATELVRAIRDRQFSVREVVSAFLDRIEDANPTVNAIISMRPRETVLAEADAADSALAAGATPGALFGLPVAVKDLALTKGLTTTFGSPIFADFVPTEDDIFVERMRAAGAIVIGKTNVPEFGLGSHSYNPVFGVTRNALNPGLTAGGSSGGAAAALALDMLPIADGSDMGGSLRNPAGWNGVFGFRPSQGRVPSASSPDLFMAQMGVEGPMGRNVADMALLLDVMSGYDVRAPLSLAEGGDFLASLQRPLETARIGWLGDVGGHLAMEEGVLELCEAALARLQKAGYVIEEAALGFDAESVWQAFVTLRHATSGAALKPLYDDPGKRPLLKPEAVWEIEGALGLTAPKIRQATEIRSAWYGAVLGLFRRYDFLALPTAQVFAFDAGLHWPDEIGGRTMDSYHRWMEVTAYATMAGLPAAAVPVDRGRRDRSMGLQLIGPPRSDADTLRIAAAFERFAAAK
ncbi:MAG: amidase [Rhizobiaceae bacterium]|nr:amidase [Rhizobiaceae bacterium]MCV0408765.1 amidase [Rhizobiaceae bacterium]